MSSRFQQIRNLRQKISTILIMGTAFGMPFLCRAQLPEEDPERSLVIRSGVHGVIGGSQLYLHNELRPDPLINEHYKFGLDLFLKAGAMITVQPPFLGDYFQLVTDPSFSKYSWGNFRSQFTDSIESEIDIDLEALEFPLSVRFTVFPYSRVVRPFIRAGYTFAWIIENEALFRTKIQTEYTNAEYYYDIFPFSDIQHLLMLSLGAEFDLRYVDYTLELVIQKGGGIDTRGNGRYFMSLSNTTNYYFQLGILF